jgi:hypothetical protein
MRAGKISGENGMDPNVTGTSDLPPDVEVIGEAEPFIFDRAGNLSDKEPRQRGQRAFL